jgi:uncharacterized protein (TIGR02271 family)
MAKNRMVNGGLNEAADGESVLPLMAEELEISKERKERGRIRISKRVRRDAKLVDEILHNESYDVKRVPVNRTVEAPVEPRREGETLILPILEEVLVVEKRLVLVEELHITRNVQNKPERREVELRREEIDIERFKAEGA